MVGSNLVTDVFPAHKGNYTFGRQGRRIQKVTLHHMASCLTAKRCGEVFQKAERKASSHYGIGFDGKIAQYVSEADTAWTDGDWESNLSSVTIECANAKASPPWPIGEKTLESLVLLLADIARRNGLGPYVKGKNLTWHRMYAKTTCPGEDMLSKMDEIVKRANEMIQKECEKKVSVQYQVYSSRWLPFVTGASVSDAENGYGGILGEPISGIRAEILGSDLFYRVHVKGGEWLPEVKNKEDYAGILGKPIDGVMLKSPDQNVFYRVHTPEDGWLPEVSGYSETDSENGFAGVYGHTVDALLIRTEPKTKEPVKQYSNEEKWERIRSLWEEADPILTEMFLLLEHVVKE